MRDSKDETIALPLLREPLPGILSFDILPLRRIARAPDSAFSLVSRSAALRGRVSHGIDRAWIHDLRVLDTFRVVDAACDHAALTPISVERTLAVGESRQPVVERILLLPDTAGIIIEWSAETDTAFDIAWRCDLSMRGDRLSTRPLAWSAHNDGNTIAVVQQNRGAAAYYVLSHPPMTYHVEIDTDGAIVRARLRTGASGVRLHVVCTAAADTDAAHHTDAERTLDTMRSASTILRALAGSQRRRMADGISVESSEPALDAAIEWSTQAIAQYPTHRMYPSAMLAALAAGEHDVARRMLDACDITSAAFLQLVARYYAWTGDTRYLNAQWSRLTDAAVCSIDHVYGGDTAGEIDLRTGGLASFATLAADLGRSALPKIGEVVKRERARHADALRGSHWPAALSEPPARDAGLFMQGRVEQAASHILLAAGADTIDPVAVIVPFVYGLLGVEPDAPKGRLRIRMQPPAGWDSLRVRNLVVGDAMISVDWEGDGRRHVFRASQTEGAVPLTLILEPRVAASRLLRASVDGLPAVLDAVRVGNRLSVPVQIVLDDARVLEVEVEP